MAQNIIEDGLIARLEREYARDDGAFALPETAPLPAKRTEPYARRSASRPISGMAGGAKPSARPAATPADKRDWRARAVYVLSAPLLLSGVFRLMGGDVIGAGLAVGAFALIASGASAIRRGLGEEAAYDAAAFAEARFPRKLLGAGLIGAGVFLSGAALWGVGLFQSVILGAMATGAAVGAFGLDPLRRKGDPALVGVSHEALREALDEANAKIDMLDADGARLKDSPLRERVAAIAAKSRRIVARIEADPRDLRRARRWLRVYLEGAREATKKYADAQGTLDDSETYIKFRNLLIELEQVFAHQYETLLSNDRMGLDVELDVLADRLKQEAPR